MFILPAAMLTSIRENIVSNRLTTLLTGLILVALIGILDSFTGSEISFSIFYLIPIVFISWYTGRSWGLVFALLSAITWFIIDSREVNRLSINAIHYWNGLVRLGFFSIVVYLITELKNFNVVLEEKIRKRTADLIEEVNEHDKSRNEIIRKSNQLRELTKKFEKIKEEKDIELAREIHDELGQYLTAINLEVMWINKKHSGNKDLFDRTLMISNIINDTIKSIRRISSSLRPRLLDQLGLLPAIESLAKEFQNKTGIICITEFPPGEIKISPEASATLFRIYQEALTNIARHSKATDVVVSIKNSAAERLLLSVKDNGTGFNSAKLNVDSTTLGILGMKERAINLGGELNIISSPGSGTEVILEIQLNKTNKKHDQSNDR